MRDNHTRSIRLRALVPIPVEPAALLDLFIDLKRYVQVEPKLAEARWLPGPQPPSVGATAQVTAQVDHASATRWLAS